MGGWASGWLKDVREKKAYGGRIGAREKEGEDGGLEVTIEK